MSADPIRVTFRCKACQTPILIPEDATDESQIDCIACGREIGTLISLKKKAAAEVANRMIDGLEAALTTEKPSDIASSNAGEALARSVPSKGKKKGRRKAKKK